MTRGLPYLPFPRWESGTSLPSRLHKGVAVSRGRKQLSTVFVLQRDFYGGGNDSGLMHSVYGCKSQRQKLQRRWFSGEAALARTQSQGVQELNSMEHGHLGNRLKFHHLHFYVNRLAPLEEYKQIEEKLNSFVAQGGSSGEVDSARKKWEQVNAGSPDPSHFVPHGQDMVKQMLVGAGWRIAGVHEGGESTSYHVAAHDNPREGVAIVVTAAEQTPKQASQEPLDHFHAKNVNQYFEAHGFRQGCAVLAFHSPNVAELHEKYRDKHPALIRAGFPKSYGSTKILEVYAYYAKGSSNKPDLGTVVRFVEEDPYRKTFPLPGMQPVSYELSDKEVCAAYPDHWVSNVFDREQVLRTFEDVFGFQPKVNFNAGVVGAGEAVIESTVTGNEPGLDLSDEAEWFKNQDQIYLPINNALSEHGHVHHYLEQVGQGVQHFASRVKSLPDFIARANKFREITGEGLAFLDIPRSYYGSLRATDFVAGGVVGDVEIAEKMLAKLREAKIVDEHNIVAVDLDLAEVERVLLPVVTTEGSAEAARTAAGIVSRGRYRNLYELMQDTLSEAQYLQILRNKILVDVQGKDVLLQIFSKPVLMSQPGEQAPFFEFIQRVCDREKATLTPGCGGFGIRNFLTLFLSIEVSNFMDIYEKACAEGNEAEKKTAKKAVEIFTSQLNASNPVLTQISDALEKQTLCMEELAKLQKGSPAFGEKLQEIEKWEAEKLRIQEVLKAIGEDHKQQMAALMKQKAAEV